MYGPVLCSRETIDHRQHRLEIRRCTANDWSNRPHGSMLVLNGMVKAVSFSFMISCEMGFAFSANMESNSHLIVDLWWYRQ